MKVIKANIKIKKDLNIYILVLASLSFSLMTVCVKKIRADIPIYELVFFRSVFSLIITSIIINHKNISPWGENKPLLILRGVLGTLALLFIFYSIRTMPLNYSTLIQYTYPIFISIFAGIFINEKVSRNIIIASIIGWLGIIIILNPYQLNLANIEIKRISIIIAFLGAICTSLAYLTVRKLSEKENIFIIINYFPLISAVILFPIVLINWVTPNFYDFIWILGIGIFTQSGQTFLTLGLKKMKASKASNINYLQVIFGSLWGVFIFGEQITITFIFGTILVFLGTILSSSKISK